MRKKKCRYWSDVPVPTIEGIYYNCTKGHGNDCPKSSDDRCEIVIKKHKLTKGK